MDSSQESSFSAILFLRYPAFLPNRPANAKFLKSEEKVWLATELRREEVEKSMGGRITAGRTLAHRQVWYLTAIYFSQMLSMYVVVFWMPHLIKASFTQYSNTLVGILVMIPYVMAAVAMTLIAHSSDRVFERRHHAAVPSMVAAVALLLLGTIGSPSPWLLMVLWCFVTMGIWSFMGPSGPCPMSS